MQREGDHGVAEDLPGEGDRVVRNVEEAAPGHREVEQRHQKDERAIDRPDGEKRLARIELLERLEHGVLQASSAARPLGANRPCGRRWMKRMTKTSTVILASTAPAYGSRSLFTRPKPAAAITVPAGCPTTP